MRTHTLPSAPSRTVEYDVALSDSFCFPYEGERLSFLQSSPLEWHTFTLFHEDRLMEETMEKPSVAESRDDSSFP